MADRLKTCLAQSQQGHEISCKVCEFTDKNKDEIGIKFNFNYIIDSQISYNTRNCL